MQVGDICFKRTVAAAIRAILMVALFTAVLLFAKDPVFAEDGTDAALTVVMNGQTVWEFTSGDLLRIATDEDNRSYDYSFWDNSPAFDKEENVHGPTVEAVLTEAGIRDDVKASGTVSFEGSTGETAILTGKQLFDEARYYYPHGDQVKYPEGTIPEEAYEDAVEVKAVISLDAGSGNGLFIGQAAPNDQNAVVMVSGISSGGTIRVSTEEAPKCAAPVMDPDSGTWRPGKEISISTGGEADGYQSIYFSYGRTSSPGYGSILYNYGNGQDMEFKPEVPADGKSVYVCASVRCYGMQDSAVKRALFYIGDALTVDIDGETVTYDTEELSSFYKEGSLTYSGYNSYPTFSKKTINKYAFLEEIIEDAAGKPVADFAGDSVIRLTGSDGYDTVFTMEQLFGTERYYYPNAETGSGTSGGRAPEAAYEGRVEVPAIIAVDEDDTFYLGQADPNDQNFPECVKYMFSRGTIEISTSEAAKCGQMITTAPAPGSVIAPGTAIYFPMPEGSKLRDKVNYIVDPEEGEIPDRSCDLYNYAPFRYNTSDLPNLPANLVNAPVLSEPGLHTIAVRISAYGKKDGDTALFRFFVGSGTGSGLNASASAYNAISVTWNNVSGAAGYKLYRRAGSGAEMLYTTFGPGTSAFTDTGITIGTPYSYRLAVIAKDANGNDLEFNYPGSASAMTQLGIPELTLKAGKRKMTVKWGMIPGASGYEIYRSTKKSSGFKKVKTITKGSTVSFVNKKLKKGKKYYYRIRAYTTVGGVKIYSGDSAVKNKKVK